jgi:hypothetical protein
LEFSESGAKLYDCGYEQYLEQRDNTVEIVDKPKSVQKEKKGYYNPLKEQQKKDSICYPFYCGNYYLV